MFGPEDSVRLKISPQVRALFSLISEISEYANFFFQMPGSAGKV